MSAEEPLIRYEAVTPYPVTAWAVYENGNGVGNVHQVSDAAGYVATSIGGARVCYGATRAEAVSALIKSLETS